jgi:alanyl-tRNA synthetase
MFLGENNELYSGELCCGTHASNTGQLGKLLLTGFTVVGDSTFELDGCVSDHSLTVEQKDKLVLEKLERMRELNKLKSGQQSPKESHETANQIAQLSSQIEEIFKQDETSYLTLQRVKQEAIEFRPSKNLLSSLLKKYVETELKKDDKNRQFLMFESILVPDAIVNGVLKKATNLPEELIFYNKYRAQFILYSSKGNSDEYFNMVQEKILKDHPRASVSDSSKKHRIIKCSLNDQLEKDLANSQAYFNL